ncbi:MAG TPA: EamA family transporter [Rubricoccaceae bacterium]|nr:EamA family transporter [Rubricoccaceae bacterium]
MIWLALTVACSLAVAAVFKVSERRGLDRTAVLTVNYAVAGAVAAVLLGGEARAQEEVEAGFVALGAATGALFIGGFYVFAYAIREAGMGLAAAVMRLSVVVPFLASWLAWGERPTGVQLLGLALAGAAFFLLARPAAEPVRSRAPADGSAGRGGTRTAVALGLLFLAGGLADTAMKAYDEAFGATGSRPLFLLLVFGVAFLVGLGGVVAAGVRTGRWPRAAAAGWGAALGLANYGSVEFVLRALGELQGTFVFPANNVAIVMGAALLGVAVWGERLSRRNWLGLGVAALALVFLAPR